MDTTEHGTLPYIIKGKQLDRNEGIPKSRKLIWRTDKSQAQIESILQQIHQNIHEIAGHFDIQESDIALSKLPLITHNNESAQNIHSCHYEFGNESDRDLKRRAQMLLTQRKKHAKHNLSARKSNFLTKRFILTANKQLQKACNKHILFCKNQPKNTPHNPKIQVQTQIFLCQNKDWIEEYKQSIQPVVCGRFYIRPSWHAHNPQYQNLIIDPSLSFGSGHHATTAMCIQALDSMDLRDKSMLDVGCGSGILSLVGANLGARVYACDTDSEACAQSRQNFEQNALTYQHIWHGSIQSLATLELPQEYAKEYDCICANIVSSVLLLLRNELIARLKEGGTLIVSGILEEHEERILEGFGALKLMEKKQIDEWLCFKFIKK